MNKNHFAILMAGGVGSRFWPVSTEDNPKQFHDLLGAGKTLIQKTFDRLSKIIPAHQIYILTNERYFDLVMEQLPQINEGQVVTEPAMRNTAPCILYASLKIKKINSEAQIIVAPSDHWIEDENAFIAQIESGFQFTSESEGLLTLGIVPTFPNTGYGYIEFDKTQSKSIKKVQRFCEKPNYETAQTFLKQGNFLWNAGIFLWSVQSVVSAFKTHQPQMYELFKAGWEAYNTDQERNFILANYSKAENVSVDYAIMEKSDQVFTLPAHFDWNDLGTWGSLFDKLTLNKEDNVSVNNKLLEKNASGNIIHTATPKVVVVEDLHDFIVVEKPDVLMIYPKSKEQDIKALRQKVKEEFGDNYI